ncbi:MAG: CDP-diacylglycerol--glycerol-3-phosphate 3-phosphatidyltransferase [Alphaproteobacteria bacterium]|nr:CDP-diacylglycerol--glycerol-3-phosphate 3-phosphatidyltransferase [Alphaproteobacteria bacterium]
MTIPNILTLLRVALIPIIVVLMIAGDSDAARWWAFSLFVASALTDYFDGWLARKLKQESDFGRLFDPIADKLLVVAVYFVLVNDDIIAGWNVLAVVLIVSRELLVSALREFLAGRGIPMPSSKQAKYKTAVQLATGAALIVSPLFGPLFGVVAIIGLWLATALTISSGYGYWMRSSEHISARADKAGE